MTNSTPESVLSKKRIRSPAYPYVALPKAIDYARKFWDKEKRNFASIPITVAHWGFISNTGPAGQIIGTLTQFGLMESVGEKEARKVKLTEHAFRILATVDRNSAAYLSLIQRSALLPKLYADLMAKYPTGLPSDDSLKHELEYERDFNPGVVAEVVRSFRETVAFAKLDGSDTIPSSEDESSDTSSDIQEVDDVPETERIAEQRASAPASTRKSAPTTVDDPSETERLRFNLKGGRRVRLMFTGHLPTQADIEKLIANLELNKDTFPETVEDEQ